MDGQVDQAQAKPPALEAEADRAAGARRRGARRATLLERATAADPDRGEAWLKLAAMCRAQGDLQAALAAGLRRAARRSARLRAAAAQGQPARAAGPGGRSRRDLRLCARPGAGGGAAASRGDGRACPRAPRRRMSPRAAGRLAEARPTGARSDRDRGSGRLARFRTNILRTHPALSFRADPFPLSGPPRARVSRPRPSSPGWPGSRRRRAAITEDFHRVMAAERAELVPYIQYPDDVPLRQWAALNRNKAWTAIHLVQNGVTIEANARHCPAVMALLGRARPARRSRGAGPMRCSRCSRRARISRRIPASPIPGWSAICR